MTSSTVLLYFEFPVSPQSLYDSEAGKGVFNFSTRVEGPPFMWSPIPFPFEALTRPRVLFAEIQGSLTVVKP